MKTITFAGIEGTIISQSPHGNFVCVSLADHLTVCGTYSNKFKWEDSPESESGFNSFIVYLGVNSNAEVENWLNLITEYGGYCKPDESEARPAKRVTAYPLEIKVRGLTPEAVVKLAQGGCDE
ncbi:MAG: hypothetical protein RLZZ490_971 [Cyanobacteriota bacterium]